MSFTLFYKSVHGYNHQLKGLPCEDFGLVSELKKGKIFAVADGHGDTRCMRSKVGSQLACEVAERELALFAEKVTQEGKECLFDSKEADIFVRTNLIKPICDGWKQAVLADWRNRPFSDEELEQAEQWKDYLANGIGIEQVYGTTLMAGFVNEEYLLLIQQGDGHCDVFDIEGKPSQPIPWDDRCLGSTTTSLCESDAWESFRVHVTDLEENPISACILGTDGVEDSYRFMEQLHTFYQKLMLRSVELPIDEFEAELEQCLLELTKDGSGDDITVSGVLDLELIQSCREQIKNEIMLTERFVTAKNTLRSAEDKINSMARKRNYLEQQYLRIQQEVETLEKEFEEQKDVEQLVEAKKRLKDMEEEYLPYQRRFEEQQDIYAQAMKELEELNVK